MNTLHPPFTNIRSFIGQKFSTLHMRAARDSFWRTLTGKGIGLEIFPRQIRRRDPNRQWLGMRDIPVERIVGVLNKPGDFDHQFRPLHAHMLDRWTRTYLQIEREGWPSVLLHKIDDKYYVENDQYIVSVARESGLGFIQAEIWEYPAPVARSEKGKIAECVEKKPATIRVAG
jgi:hypothetical protein